MYPLVTPLSAIEQRLVLIESQLAQGWRIEGPVIARSSGRGDQRKRAFEFVLRNPWGFQVIAVPESPAVEQFLCTHELATIEI